eukprot:11012387-Alexandrium_andersonii.AAC.1
MSASLVGSEMCIRDRVEWKHSGNIRFIRGQPKSGTSMLAGALQLGFLPVSYTHLTLPTICSV